MGSKLRMRTGQSSQNPRLILSFILSLLPIFSHNTKNDENEMGEKLPNLNFILTPSGNENEIVVLGSLKMILRMRIIPISKSNILEYHVQRRGKV
jgi:hypothetical protein